MASTSAEQLAKELLEHCLASRPWPEHLLEALIAPAGNNALFRIVVERLGDLFEPRLCDVYADLFTEVIARRIPELHAEHLLARYQRIRQPHKLNRTPKNVFVLSRVTLGADVAVTSVLLDAAKNRFRVGDGKHSAERIICERAGLNALRNCKDRKSVV